MTFETWQNQFLKHLNEAGLVSSGMLSFAKVQSYLAQVAENFAPQNRTDNFCENWADVKFPSADQIQEGVRPEGCWEQSKAGREHTAAQQLVDPEVEIIEKRLVNTRQLAMAAQQGMGMLQMQVQTGMIPPFQFEQQFQYYQTQLSHHQTFIQQLEYALAIRRQGGGGAAQQLVDPMVEIEILERRQAGVENTVEKEGGDSGGPKNPSVVSFDRAEVFPLCVHSKNIIEFSKPGTFTPEAFEYLATDLEGIIVRKNAWGKW